MGENKETPFSAQRILLCAFSGRVFSKFTSDSLENREQKLDNWCYLVGVEIGFSFPPWELFLFLVENGNRPTGGFAPSQPPPFSAIVLRKPGVDNPAAAKHWPPLKWTAEGEEDGGRGTQATVARWQAQEREEALQSNTWPLGVTVFISKSPMLLTWPMI